jgi:ABC-type cobalt transport system substrate-binding protein
MINLFTSFLLDMSSLPFLNTCTQLLQAENLHQLPQTFAESIAQVKAIALETFDREIAEKHLCYHTREHIEGVQRRATLIFQAIRPHLNPEVDRDRMELLLDLCAIAHDLIQVFVPSVDPHTARRREAGVSETATIEKLLEFIRTVNLQSTAQFTGADLALIQEAIAATICDYDPTEQAIFQPALSQPISLVARILALADIGSLGIEGIEAYNAEGSLLFLEENLDVRSLRDICPSRSLLATPVIDQPELGEILRQRLLKRARFQVSFAKSRLKRFSQEMADFPAAALPAITHEVFQFLTPATLQRLEETTPTAADTSLETLIAFFQFDAAYSALSLKR